MHPQARAELAALQRRFQRQVDRKIISLATNPRPRKATRLTGTKLKGLWKLRSGDYRIIYQIRETAIVVLVLKIGDRKDVYKSLQQLISRARAPLESGHKE